MKLVFTHENLLIVSNMQNILSSETIDVVIKNRYAAGGAGDIAPHETWPELWVTDESDYTKAMQIIDAIQQPQQNTANWFCPHCHEQNAGNFELCWNCQTERQ